MLWKTHIRISNEALRRLDITLTNDVYSRFKEGIIAPTNGKTIRIIMVNQRQ